MDLSFSQFDFTSEFIFKLKKIFSEKNSTGSDSKGGGNDDSDEMNILQNLFQSKMLVSCSRNALNCK